MKKKQTNYELTMKFVHIFGKSLVSYPKIKFHIAMSFKGHICYEPKV